MRTRSFSVIAVVVAVLAVAGVLMFFGLQASQRADRALETAAQTQVALDKSTADRVAADKAAAAERVAADKAAADKAAQAARDEKLVNDAVKKATESKPATSTRVPTSSGITLSSLGSKPCAALGARGVSYGRMLDYYASFGFPASMDIDNDGYACETVYGNMN
jgi:hypothetical protein